MSLHAHKITQAAFKEALSRYPALIESFESTSGPSLKSLDEERLESIPEKVKAREQPHLKKEELQSVLSCKMKRGKHRPTLKAFASNLTEKEVQDASTKAFSALPEKPTTSQIQASLKELETLKGIGPATASYLLAVYDKEQVPVFSDEAFRWICWDMNGREKKIKYTRPEYLEYVEEVRKVAERLEVNSGEVERVGWVLGKEKASIEAGAGPAKRKEEKMVTKVPAKVAESKAGADSDQLEAKAAKAAKPTKRARADESEKPKPRASAEPQRKSRRLAEKAE